MSIAGHRRLPFWHQLPVYSPLSLSAWSAGARAMVGLHPGARQALREHLLDEHRVADALLFGSGTAALQAALEIALRQAVRSGGGRALALPAYSCFDVASAAVWTGAQLHFYDVDPETLAPDLTTLQEAFEMGASVLLVSPLYGLPVPWKPIEDLARSYGVTVVHDAAQSFGLQWEGGRPQGDYVVLSLGKGKGWTGGGGGVVLLSSDTSAERSEELGSARFMKEARVVLGALAQWLLGRPEVYGIPVAIPWLKLGETVYHPPQAPHPLSNASAAIAFTGRTTSKDEVSRRIRRARELLARLPESPVLRPVGLYRDPGAAFLRLPLVGSRGMRGFPFPDRARRFGITPGYPIPLPELPAVAENLVRSRSWPGAKLLSEGLITVPTHSRLRQGDIEALVDLVSEYQG